MRNPFVIFVVLAALIVPAVSCQKAERAGMKKPAGAFSECGKGFEFHDGDIVFQTSKSQQSRAIQLATHSKYSHVGIITIRKGTTYVYEAVDRVRLTPVEDWIKKGEQGEFSVKRLSRYETLPRDVFGGMRSVGKQFRGRRYDPDLRWDDEKLYCSELVRKVYEGGGIEIGNMETVKDLDLSTPEVKEMMRERFGDNIPYDEPIITPASIYDDEQLIEVCSTY